MINLHSDIIADISPDDGMYVAGDEGHYFRVGQSALDGIGVSLQAARLPVEGVGRILDLPCGHGRVMRYLRAAFPDAEIVACDLLRGGVDFCASAFGAVPVYSAEDPSGIDLGPGGFDLIWVGSLFTHLDSGRWADFLRCFRRCLRPGGVLVFSAHGREAYSGAVRGKNYGLPFWRVDEMRYSYERTGFGYGDYPDSDSYGVSLSSPAWVFRQIAAVGEMRLVHLSEKAWDNHQDIYACVRDPDWLVDHPPRSPLAHLRSRLRVRHRLWELSRRFRRGPDGGAAG